MQSIEPYAARRSRRRWIFRGILVLFLFGIAELGGLVGLKILNRRYPMDPMAEITPRRVETFLKNRHDPVCGWMPNKVLSDINSIGARRRDEYDGDFEYTISAYGDSYTYGLNVHVEYCWPMQLEQMINIPVLNFAAEGFGTDQALLKLEDQYDEVPSHTVLFGIQAENINRCVSVYRGFYQSGFSPPKPFFVLDADGRAEPVNPFATPEDVRRLLLDQPEALWDLASKHDYWYQQIELFGRPWQIRFPYSLQLIARTGFVTRRLGIALTGMPSHGALYEDPAALEIMQQIVARLGRFAQAKRFHALVVVLPTIRDCRILRVGGTLPYQPLLDFLDKENLTYLDTASALARQTDLESLFIDGEAHYTDVGGRIVAQEVKAFLMEENALPPPPLPTAEK